MDRRHTSPDLCHRKDRERWGPELYMHFEFRLSWNRRSQSTRSPRDRRPAFTRQNFDPYNHNNLAAIHQFDQQQTRYREFRQWLDAHPHMHEYYQEGHLWNVHQQPRAQHPEVGRQPRAEAWPTSHARGQSAPPPTDLSSRAIGQNFSAGHMTFHQTTELPPIPPAGEPSEFRLGEGQEPWPSWSFPADYDRDTYRREEHQSLAPPPPVAPGRNSVMFATNPAMVSVFSPDTPAAATAAIHSDPVDDIQRNKARELEALSVAMVTVDSGFENQPWPGDTQEAADAPTRARRVSDPSSSYHDHDQRDHQEQGWPLTKPEANTATRPGSFRASSLLSPASEGPRTHEMLPDRAVTPLSDAARSPVVGRASIVQRSLSTRSDELWIWTGREG